MKKGLFITFEGSDKSGKTTQANLLAQYLENSNVPNLKTREPGGTKIACDIRDIILAQKNDECEKICELLLFYAARADHIEKVIKPAIIERKIVICDRFFDSSYVYQYEVMKKFPKLVKALNEAIIKNFVPDRTYLLILENEKLAIRREKTQKTQKTNRFDNKKQQFHVDIQNKFINIAKNDILRFKIIDANLNIEKVKKQIIDDFNHSFRHIIPLVK